MTNDQLREFVDSVKESEEFDKIRVVDFDPREGWADVEWDERPDSAMQVTRLQKQVTSSAPYHPGIEVYRADITTKRVKFTLGGDQ